MSRVQSIRFFLLAAAIAVMLALAHAHPVIELEEDAWKHASTDSQLPAAVESLLPNAPFIPHNSKLGKAKMFDLLKNPVPEIAARAQLNLNCTVCETLVALLQPVLLKNTTEEVLIVVATGICELVHPLCHSPAACKEVCVGIVGEYTNVTMALIKDLATPIDVCAALKQCPAPTPPTPSTIIPVASNLENLQGEINWPSWDLTSGMGTFVHLSDAHLDPAYVVGSLAGCPLPVCCHASDGTGTNASDTAGYWGDYRCDTTLTLAQNVLEFIANMDPQPDFILYTGDDPDHRVYEQTREGNLRALNLWSGLLNDTVGAMGIPVFHCLGNHEIFPVNQFQGPVYDSWLYNSAVEAWAPFLPQDAQATMAYGGYYQARVRPGLRLIAMNSNYFTDDNFWLLANLTYAQDQLNWIGSVLEQAQALDEKVILSCHAPFSSWDTHLAESFFNLTENYRDIILNFFMGHTHQNEYAALHDSNMQPMHVAWTGGSLVPYTSLNPGFSVYTYNRANLGPTSKNLKADNSSSYLVQDAYAHWMHLDEANENNNTDIQWTPVRSDFRNDFNVPDLSPTSLYQLAPNYVTNSTLLQTYIFRMYKGFPQSSTPNGKSIMCDTSTNTAQENHDCKHKQGLLEQHIQKEAEMKEAAC